MKGLISLNRATIDLIDEPQVKLKVLLLDIKLILFALTYVIIVGVCDLTYKGELDLNLALYITVLLVGCIIVCYKGSSYISAQYYYRFPEYRENKSSFDKLPKSIQVEILNDKIQNLEENINKLEIELKCLKYN